MTKRQRRTFTDEFKEQMVKLYESGKPKKDIIAEYDLTPTAFNTWIKRSQETGSFKEKDNRSPEENELIKLRKENQKLKMENDIFKASGADIRTKVNVIKNNSHKYSISAMCKVLQLSRSTYYYESKQKIDTDKITPKVIDIFKASRNNYGTRKIKVELNKLGFIVSRRKIGRIMKENGLVSNYTVAQYKPHPNKCNESKISNELNRKFNTNTPYSVVVSDLTYVRVDNKWNYVCILIDLYNREIIGHSVGKYKDANLVYRAFSSVSTRLDNITLFHTDRGNEFKNKIIDEVLDTFNIKRSLSMKGCPYDNAVAGATFKIFKTEFAKNYHFESLQQLEIMLLDYINWFNNFRIHSTLGYLSPRDYKLHNLKKTV
ncbi:IS3 family transposase [Clostridium sp. D2Q-14]|uniref:IS3 family transposase n=1 Tax=Anaeromonas gelatinilytica TaxID=2683194 RepID=UPI00193BB84A|nr:IS3 family transposase [Anaeromonas gelatinilytica]MBS4535599.1 IS3 family transposase [Anaeromonas gelatinilytica]